MPRIPGISSEQAIRVFQKVGFKIIRQGKHVIMSDGIVRLSIPRNNPVNAITMGSIARDAGLSPREFLELL